MEDTTAHDLNRLFDAIRAVRQTAVVESAAVSDMLATPSDGAMRAVHDAHLAELDAVQAMGAAFELLIRRHPAFMNSIGAAGPIAAHLPHSGQTTAGDHAGADRSGDWG